jgi:uncharacterized membrane protein YphA (DoxX/SURF4 family)
MRIGLRAAHDVDCAAGARGVRMSSWWLHNRALFLGALFLLIVGSGAWSIDARVTRHH